MTAQVVIFLDQFVQRDDERYLEGGCVIGELFELSGLRRIRGDLFEPLHDFMNVFAARVAVIAIAYER